LIFKNDFGRGNSQNSGFSYRHYLGLGIVGAIVIWVTMGTRPVGYNSDPNPVGIALGVVSLFQGVVVCVLFQAIGLISETLLELRNKFMDEPESEEKSLEALMNEKIEKKRSALEKYKQESRDLEIIERAIKAVEEGYSGDIYGVSYGSEDIEELRSLRQETLDILSEAEELLEPELNQTDLKSQNGHNPKSNQSNTT